jgi:hypothetical protein
MGKARHLQTIVGSGGWDPGTIKRKAANQLAVVEGRSEGRKAMRGGRGLTGQPGRVAF